MATYTRSNKIKKAYKTCEGLYLGCGPVDCMPKRIKITAFFSKKRQTHRMNFMLTVVE